jgi:hypothetical protein
MASAQVALLIASTVNQTLKGKGLLWLQAKLATSRFVPAMAWPSR